MTTAKKKFNVKLCVLLPITIILTLVVWCLPTDFGMEGLTLQEHRTIAIFVMAALLWIFEIIPVWATSVLVTVVMLFTMSDSALPFFKHASANGTELGHLISYKSILATYADQVVMLFLGGFVLAQACSKVGLDKRFAHIMLKPFGKQSRFVLLGFLIVIAILSMFMSNTATAAMMLTFLVPVLKSLPPDGKGRIGLAMAIPIACNLGGMGTPIGTPPNAVALGYLSSQLGYEISFAHWMAIMVPYVIVMILIAWVLILALYPFKQKTIEIDIHDDHQTTWKTWVVGITFAVTVLLWILESVVKINSYVVGMLPLGVFAVTGILTKEDLGELNWSVLWLVAGGFALGLAMQDTGFAAHMVNSLPFGSWSPFVVLIVPGIIAYFISNFISNSGTAALLIPIVTAVAIGMGDRLNSVGGAATVIVGVAISCSLAMLFPISTPPNAIAHSTGMVTTKDMIKLGLPLGLIGFVLGYFLLNIVHF